jgi:GDP-L-fucose synthase
VTRTHAELDLCNQAVVQDFFATEQPTQVYLATAKAFISKVKELTKLTGGAYRNTQFSAKFIWRLAVEFNQRELSR